MIERFEVDEHGVKDNFKDIVYYTDVFSSLLDLIEVMNELYSEKESWKNSSCIYVNKNSVLSMDCQIVQEALWDLEKKIYDNYLVNEEIIDSLKDLKVKFNNLNNHRLE